MRVKSSFTRVYCGKISKRKVNINFLERIFCKFCELRRKCSALRSFLCSSLQLHVLLPMCYRNHQGLLVNKVIVVKFSAKNEPFKFSLKDRGSRQHPRRHHQRRYPSQTDGHAFDETVKSTHDRLFGYRPPAPARRRMPRGSSRRSPFPLCALCARACKQYTEDKVIRLPSSCRSRNPAING